jgi:ABC-type multidrug transport system fused ATPase/permease subunit
MICAAWHAEMTLVGRSGAGKTTLASLIPRLYNPQCGAICIDGIDIGNVRLADLRKRIGIVAQEAFIFSGTFTVQETETH